jgi:hypothetical protein
MYQDRPQRKDILQERLYANTAAAVLEKQHQRFRDQAEAIIQATGWMRTEDLTEGEINLRDAAINLFASEVQQRISV